MENERKMRRKFPVAIFPAKLLSLDFVITANFPISFFICFHSQPEFLSLSFELIKPLTWVHFFSPQFFFFGVAWKCDIVSTLLRTWTLGRRCNCYWLNFAVIFSCRCSRAFLLWKTFYPRLFLFCISQMCFIFLKPPFFAQQYLIASEAVLLYVRQSDNKIINSQRELKIIWQMWIQNWGECDTLAHGKESLVTAINSLLPATRRGEK